MRWRVLRAAAARSSRHALARSGRDVVAHARSLRLRTSESH
jgi:hypothetical protein